MSAIEAREAREFAKHVVEKLRDAGFDALWAGGCVRDQLLGRRPKDFDVATSATPEQIRQVFGRRRTIEIGAAFGVITVLGRREQGQIEVATFRQDAAYSDGRHPDSVTFSSAEEDAKRRDFTINGLFFDPLEDRVIDFVGGQEDLAKKMVRAIGDPDERIGEDKLRMLRAVRFAATFGFELDDATAEAIRRRADELTVVSAERIADEMRRMLTHSNRSRAVTLLQTTNLMGVILPEAELWQSTDADESVDAPWRRTLALLDQLDSRCFPSALAALLRESAIVPGADAENLVRQVGRRWKLANDEVDTAAWLLKHEAAIRTADKLPWPQVQRVLIDPNSELLIDFAGAICDVYGEPGDGVAFCLEKLQLPADQLNPAPLIDGNDLKAAGIDPGPAFKSLLEQTRDAQLEGKLHSKQDALEFATAVWANRDAAD